MEALGNRADAVKHYQKTENKWKRELKNIRKQNTTLFSMAKLLGSLLELKKINNTHSKVSKKNIYYISDSSSSDPDSYLSSDI